MLIPCRQDSTYKCNPPLRYCYLQANKYDLNIDISHRNSLIIMYLIVIYFMLKVLFLIIFNAAGVVNAYLIDHVVRISILINSIL